MFLLLTHLNLQGRHHNNWMKEEQKVYALIVTTSIVMDISVGERKLFYIECEEEEINDQEPSQDEEIEVTTREEITPTISCHALVGICTPKTLKIEGYIKKRRVIVSIDPGRTHNFIHFKLAKALNCFIYPAPEFHLMIADGGAINFSRKCHKITLTMGEYVLNIPMISITMGDVDVVLVLQWLQ